MKFSIFFLNIKSRKGKKAKILNNEAKNLLARFPILTISLANLISSLFFSLTPKLVILVYQGYTGIYGNNNNKKKFKFKVKKSL